MDWGLGIGELEGVGGWRLEDGGWRMEFTEKGFRAKKLINFFRVKIHFENSDYRTEVTSYTAMHGSFYKDQILRWFLSAI